MAEVSSAAKVPWVIRRRRLAGRIMLFVACFGLVVTVVATVLAWLAVDRASRTIDDTLQVTVSALDSLEQTIELADGVIGRTAAGVATANEALGVTAGSFATAARLLDQLATLSEALPSQLEGVATGLDGVAGAADSVDRAIGLVSALPIVGDLPAAGLGNTVRSVRDELLPVAGAIAELNIDLSAAATDADLLSGHVAALNTDLGGLRSSLEEAQTLVDGYAASASEARQVAEGALADNANSFRWLKVMLVLVGVAVAAGQFVPAWLGWYLVATSPPPAGAERVEVSRALPERGDPSAATSGPGSS